MLCWLQLGIAQREQSLTHTAKVEPQLAKAPTASEKPDLAAGLCALWEL